MIASVDFRLAPDHPYPAQVQDTRCGIRWRRPTPRSLTPRRTLSVGRELRAAAIPLCWRRCGLTALSSPDVDGHDGTVAYAIAGSPLLDSYARYQYAQGIENNNLMASAENYFLNEDAMQEGSPQGILETGEDAALPPLLIIQGTADMNVPMSMPHAFVESYRATGGSVELDEYPDMPHNFILRVGKETDHALGVVKAFVAQQLTASTVATPAD